jgi:hypothetical protein
MSVCQWRRHLAWRGGAQRRMAYQLWRDGDLFVIEESTHTYLVLQHWLLTAVFRYRDVR